MNATRRIDLKKIQNMNAIQALVFSYMFGRKGRTFTPETILEKNGKSLIPEGTKEADLEKANKKAIADIAAACKFLVDAGIVEVPVAEDKTPVAGSYRMPAYNIEDLPEEKQVKIGDKVHTSLTANSGQVYYKGDLILYMPHALSPEFKAGIRIAVGELKSFHVNEEGFLYLILLKKQEVDKDGKNLKRAQCAVKASKAQLLDLAIPKGASKCVTYKKKAGLKEPELQALPDTSKGKHAIFFTNIWSPNAVHMGQIVDGIKAQLKNTTVTVINTDHQVSECAQFNIRTAPTIVVLDNGKEVERITTIPAENPNETIFKALK